MTGPLSIRPNHFIVFSSSLLRRSSLTNPSTTMKAVILIALAAAVLAEEPAYPKPTASYPAPAYNKPSYDYPPSPYSFGYEVKDNYNNDYAHSESSDGKVTTGSYRVLLPDGRTQIVTYKADDYGYVADVKYEGTAKYPEYNKPSSSYPAPTPAPYKAAPAPTPAATYTTPEPAKY